MFFTEKSQKGQDACQKDRYKPLKRPGSHYRSAKPISSVSAYRGPGPIKDYCILYQLAGGLTKKAIITAVAQSTAPSIKALLKPRAIVSLGAMSAPIP